MTPDQYYTLGKTLAEWSDNPKGKSFEEELKWVCRRFRKSRGHLYRLLGYYRLFNLALGFGPEVYALGPTQLDKVRQVIDWNHKTRSIGRGTRGKLNERDARTLINRLLHEEPSGGIDVDSRTGEETTCLS